jgi:hypothetical protein
VDPDALTPLQALNILAELAALMKGESGSSPGGI